MHIFYLKIYKRWFDRTIRVIHMRARCDEGVRTQNRTNSAKLGQHKSMHNLGTDESVTKNEIFHWLYIR